jgi:hypothetical protein
MSSKKKEKTVVVCIPISLSTVADIFYYIYIRRARRLDTLHHHSTSPPHVFAPSAVANCDRPMDAQEELPRAHTRHIGSEPLYAPLVGRSTFSDSVATTFRQLVAVWIYFRRLRIFQNSPQAPLRLIHISTCAVSRLYPRPSTRKYPFRVR